MKIFSNSDIAVDKNSSLRKMSLPQHSKMWSKSETECRTSTDSTLALHPSEIITAMMLA